MEAGDDINPTLWVGNHRTTDEEEVEKEEEKVEEEAEEEEEVNEREKGE